MDGEGLSQIPQDTDPTNIKSLVRRIESNSNHPDPFKRLSSVLCFSKLFNVIKDHETLVDEFCLEITRCVLGSLKLCHNSLEFSQEGASRHFVYYKSIIGSKHIGLNQKGFELLLREVPITCSYSFKALIKVCN